MTIWMNGHWGDTAASRISLLDHGVLYGDGIFEGIRAYGGRAFRLSAHLDRFFRGAACIMLQPGVGHDELSGVIAEAFARESEKGNPDSYLRLVCTRGEGALGLDPASCPNPTLFLVCDRISLYPEACYRQGISVATTNWRRPRPDSLDPRVKSLNYLNNVQGRAQAKRSGAQEALFLNAEGFVTECSADNIVAVRHAAGGARGHVATLSSPPGSQGALEGITLAAVLELASEAGHAVERRPMTLYDLYAADEVFLTGTGAELVPVREIDGRAIGGAFSAASSLGGEWKAGPVFNGLLARFRERRTDPAWA